MNDGGANKDAKPAVEAAALTKVDPKSDAAPTIPAEIIQAVRGRVDPNVILVQVTQRVDPAEMISATREVFKIIEEYESKDLETFKARSAALIDAKLRDPDEIDKRKNNATRRGLKIALAAFSGVSIIGGIFAAFNNGSIVVTALLLAIGVIGIAILGPLASGESVTSNDVVRVISAMGRLARLPAPEKGTSGHEDASRKQKKRQQ